MNGNRIMTAMTQEIRTYTDLLQQIRIDLRTQHPEWIKPNGQCPMCDSYVARLLELLAGPNELKLIRPRLARTEL
jgi:hypothetical protein